MKKRIILFTGFIGFVYIIISSYAAGVGFNCTGANGSQENCGGSTCHGTRMGTDTYIYVKNATDDTIAHNYIPGKTYTIHIGGSNSLLRPEFGFQFTAVKGTGTSQTTAGSYSSFPVNVASHVYGGLLIVEHTQGIVAPIPGTYETSFKWVAPAPGAGFVSMYLTLLAADGQPWADTNDISGHVSIAFDENTGVGVQDVNNPIHFTAYPNPASDALYLDMNGNEPGNYIITVYDLNGQLIYQQAANITGTQTQQTINTSSWAKGMYEVVLEKAGFYQRVAIIR